MADEPVAHRLRPTRSFPFRGDDGSDANSIGMPLSGCDPTKIARRLDRLLVPCAPARIPDIGGRDLRDENNTHEVVSRVHTARFPKQDLHAVGIAAAFRVRILLHGQVHRTCDVRDFREKKGDREVAAAGRWVRSWH